jgi:hypothetical protein
MHFQLAEKLSCRGKTPFGVPFLELLFIVWLELDDEF